MSLSYFFVFFFFNDTATTEIYTLSLHDALPISPRNGRKTATGASVPDRGPSRSWWLRLCRRHRWAPDRTAPSFFLPPLPARQICLAPPSLRSPRTCTRESRDPVAERPRRRSSLGPGGCYCRSQLEMGRWYSELLHDKVGPRSAEAPRPCPSWQI